jgi:hypothetical protein
LSLRQLSAWRDIGSENIPRSEFIFHSAAQDAAHLVDLM